MLEVKQIQPADTREIRHRVMWANEPMATVKLSEDNAGLHFGLFREGILLSVVSLFIEEDIAQFRKFATEIHEQGKGYGGQLLEFIMQESADRNVKILWCNARLTAREFYERFGFEVISETWKKGGVIYVKMQKELV